MIVMQRLTSGRELILFYLLVFALTWILATSLVGVSPVAVGIIALIPTPVAFLVAALSEGRQGLRHLWRLSLGWRVAPRWYLIVILIPTLINLTAATLALVLGSPPSPSVGLFLAYIPATLILAVGEEIGWHGYALPRMRQRLAPLPTALLFGALHAAFHLPMYLLPLPDELRQASAFPLFSLMLVAFTVFRVWFFDRTDGNVPLAIVYHTAINSSALLLNGVERNFIAWALPVIWSGAALLLLMAGSLYRRRAMGALQAP